MSIIGYIPGATQADEQIIHKRLRDWHLRGEWFAWVDEVLGFVKENFTSCESPSSAQVTSDMATAFPFADYEEQDEADVAIAAAYNKMGPRERQFISEWTDGDVMRPMTVEELSRLALTPTNGGRSRERMRMLVAKVSYRFLQASMQEDDNSLAAVESTLGNAIMDAHRPGLRVDASSPGLAPNGIGVLTFKEAENG